MCAYVNCCDIIFLFFSLLVRGCNFQHDAPQIDLGSSLKKAVVMGNIFTVRLDYTIYIVYVYYAHEVIVHGYNIVLLPMHVKCYSGLNSYIWKGSQYSSGAEC